MFAAEWIGSIFTNVAASLVLLAGGYFVGRFRERKRLQGRALTDYDFYPYVATPERFAEFSLKDFRLGMHSFLRNADPRAARQLIFIGEQNEVRRLLDEKDRKAYEKLRTKYRGEDVADDTQEFLENYRNIARLFGRTFPNMGIEVLVHDLSNPSHSITTIESGDVTYLVGKNESAETALLQVLYRLNPAVPAARQLSNQACFLLNTLKSIYRLLLISNHGYSGRD